MQEYVSAQGAKNAIAYSISQNAPLAWRQKAVKGSLKALLQRP